MIKGIINKQNHMKTILFKVDYGNKTAMDSLPLHPDDFNKQLEQAEQVTFTIIKSWVDLDIVYYAKLL